MEYEKLIGQTEEKAFEELSGMDVRVVDFSRPDKFHAETKASKRVVRIIEKDGKTVMYVAGFCDETK